MAGIQSGYGGTGMYGSGAGVRSTSRSNYQRGGRSYGGGGGTGRGGSDPSFDMPGIPPIPQPAAQPNVINYQGGGGGAQMPYQPGAPGARDIIGSLQEAGTGLLDPSSAYSKRMRNEISEDIGARSAAQERGAALRAARGGMGVGASPELLETQGDIGRAGMSAVGDATADAMLGGMSLGGQLLNPALGAEVGLQGQGLSAYMGQQQLGAQQQRDQMSANMQQQQLQAQQQRDQLQANMEAMRMRNEAMLREMSMGGGYY